MFEMLYGQDLVLSFAVIFQITGEKVAIKKITDVFIDLIDAKRILREIKLLRHFNAHENIVSILDIMSSPPGSVDIQDMYIVTNLMESDLERIIRSQQGLTDQHFQYFLYQVQSSGDVYCLCDTSLKLDHNL